MAASAHRTKSLQDKYSDLFYHWICSGTQRTWYGFSSFSNSITRKRCVTCDFFAFCSHLCISIFFIVYTFNYISLTALNVYCKMIDPSRILSKSQIPSFTLFSKQCRKKHLLSHWPNENAYFFLCCFLAISHLWFANYYDWKAQQIWHMSNRIVCTSRINVSFNRKRFFAM